MADDLITCPDCQGEKGRTVFWDGRDPQGNVIGGIRTIPCPRCGGSGQVPAAMLDWMKRGRAIRASRIARNQSMVQAAAQYGLSLSEYSNVEHGRVDPDALISKDRMTSDKALGAIREFMAENGYAPSVRELQERLGLQSTSTVAYWLERLEADGRIRRATGKARAIVVCE